MLLIYTPTNSPRLQYICQFICKELMGLSYEITTNNHVFASYKGAAINYSHQSFNNGLHLAPINLLFEQGIAPQAITCFLHKGNKAFFQTGQEAYPFDIFAASFYLLSRYEEYLPYKKDHYGRFAYENALAFKEDFLQLPIINYWVKDLIKALLQLFPHLPILQPTFSFKPSFDVDIAWGYRHKGFIRNIGGFIKQPTLERIKVLLGLQQDPFYNFSWLHQFHQKYSLNPIYFFLVAAKNGLYDKNNLPTTKAMQQLIRTHAAKYSIGIHPSWQSGEKQPLLSAEKTMLEKIAEQPIISSRQHYLRFNLPNGYQRLIKAGITDDYSMGYGSINGFRASVANTFYWYDLQKETTTNLRIHPFCFMDSNAIFQQYALPAQALDTMLYYYHTCKNVQGTFIGIWHNHFLGKTKSFEVWRNAFEKFIDLINTNKDDKL